MKSLSAKQTGDGWHVKVTETHILPTLSDVHALVRYEGLRYDDTALNEVFIYPLS